ncbi:hypothetical protein CPR_C0047 [Clostridium phage phiSM101]|uniref:hypothetical protein n=2 Tax=root TaxID=1 RepID=UPI0000DB6836|nr:hypothetical protein CPR_C0047 [Clostridium phage phiSM101]EGT0692714.1 hypothetical protein [Clostridium perfringens]ABG87896.1 hypothetical protein CPR_C0047 [Clostridium phage phiSM101]MBI6054522.1 hypothetical protein [Clostridium perfringens]MDU3018903.1 hypothetical protein [Clostridium perfringens]HBI6967488.1 hypothetical protein [Clostridium perfringens]
MKLKDIKTLREVAKENNISVFTLKTRLESKNFGLIDGEDFKKLGDRQPILLSPSGIKKILKKD